MDDTGKWAIIVVCSGDYGIFVQNECARRDDVLYDCCCSSTMQHGGFGAPFEDAYFIYFDWNSIPVEMFCMAFQNKAR